MPTSSYLRFNYCCYFRATHLIGLTTDANDNLLCTNLFSTAGVAISNLTCVNATDLSLPIGPYATLDRKTNTYYVSIVDLEIKGAVVGFNATSGAFVSSVLWIDKDKKGDFMLFGIQYSVKNDLFYGVMYRGTGPEFQFSTFDYHTGITVPKSVFPKTKVADINNVEMTFLDETNGIYYSLHTAPGGSYFCWTDIVTSKITCDVHFGFDYELLTFDTSSQTLYGTNGTHVITIAKDGTTSPVVAFPKSNYGVSGDIDPTTNKIYMWVYVNELAAIHFTVLDLTTKKFTAAVPFKETYEYLYVVD